MLLQHGEKAPNIHSTAYIAPNATICGDVTIGENTQVLFGDVIVAEGGAGNIGANCVIMENAVIRGTSRHHTDIGNNVLIGPHAHLSSCTVEDSVFLATGCNVFNGARIETRTTVRIHGIVHVKTVVPADTVVPVGWLR